MYDALLVACQAAYMHSKDPRAAYRGSPSVHSYDRAMSLAQYWVQGTGAMPLAQYWGHPLGDHQPTHPLAISPAVTAAVNGGSAVNGGPAGGYIPPPAPFPTGVAADALTAGVLAGAFPAPMRPGYRAQMQAQMQAASKRQQAAPRAGVEGTISGTISRREASRASREMLVDLRAQYEEV